MQIKNTILLVVTLLLASPSAPLRTAGTSAADTTSEALLRATAAWNGAPYVAYPQGVPELSVLRITIPARGTLPWHTHPMPNVAYLVSGEVTVEDSRGVKRRFMAGQVIPETVNVRHRGVAGDEPAVFIVFYAGAKDMPLSERQP